MLLSLVGMADAIAIVKRTRYCGAHEVKYGRKSRQTVKEAKNQKYKGRRVGVAYPLSSFRRKYNA